MSENAVLWKRLTALIALIESSPKQVLGRTSIVKLPYLLQELCGVELGYRFRLYTYGPYDAAVLNDVSSAETLKAVSVKTVYYSGGYGYEIRVADGAGKIKNEVAGWLREQQDKISHIATEFGAQSAGDLELTSTIVYLDREITQTTKATTAETLARKLIAVKPRFSEPIVLARIEELRTKGYLTSLLPAIEAVGAQSTAD